MSNKSQSLQDLEAQIERAQVSLTQLKNERDRLRQQAQHEEIDRLEQHLDQAHLRLKTLSEATEEAWQDLKADLDRLLHQISESLKKLLH